MPDQSIPVTDITFVEMTDPDTYKKFKEGVIASIKEGNITKKYAITACKDYDLKSNAPYGVLGEKCNFIECKCTNTCDVEGCKTEKKRDISFYGAGKKQVKRFDNLLDEEKDLLAKAKGIPLP